MFLKATNHSQKEKQLFNIVFIKSENIDDPDLM